MSNESRTEIAQGLRVIAELAENLSASDDVPPPLEQRMEVERVASSLFAHLGPRAIEMAAEIEAKDGTIFSRLVRVEIERLQRLQQAR